MDICRGIESEIQDHLQEILSLRSTGELKDDNTYVSKGDILCERLVSDYLKTHVPNCKVISEESKNTLDDLSDFEFVVTVDPIDGTENFVSGLMEWGVGVSVYKNMKHHQSMILLPELGVKLITGDRIERIKGSRICGLSSYMTPKDFEALGKDYEFRIMGCCMYNMYNVIRGAYCQFQHLKGCYSWDILPGINLALENGLDVTIEGKSYHGEFLVPNVKYKFVVR